MIIRRSLLPEDIFGALGSCGSIYTSLEEELSGTTTRRRFVDSILLVPPVFFSLTSTIDQNVSKATAKR